MDHERVHFTALTNTGCGIDNEISSKNFKKNLNPMMRVYRYCPLSIIEYYLIGYKAKCMRKYNVSDFSPDK